MPRLSVKKRAISQTLRAKKLCPHCGHDEFETIESKLSWLFGQKFICAKCKGTFKKANLVTVHQKERQFDANKIGNYHKAKRHKPKRKRH